ncbi:hypothetical protein G6F31_017648 [Rhizopus arrhizus]|nr:hypothetical protein G6F31_017648 [Rhizopus arrhizus]
MAGVVRDQRQPFTVVQQLLVTGDVPEREGRRIGRRIGIGMELHHGIVAGQPGRMRVARIQGRVFQQTQAPAKRRLLRRLRSALVALPVEPVIGGAAQVLPGQCERVQAQDVELPSNSRNVVTGVQERSHRIHIKTSSEPV